MNISESWLREWVNPPLTTEEIVQQITMAGLEVDSVTPVAGVFDKVVVAKIVSAEPHPDAEKLRVCSVDTGSEVLQIVCGAPNARPGIVVPLATVGAHLPGDVQIKKAKLRGVESFGMLCGQTELGVGEDDSGLWELPEDAPLGRCLREYLQLDDKVLALDLTPNRSDCLSLRGIARELGVLNRLAVQEPEWPVVSCTGQELYPINIAAPAACPRYVGRVIRGVNNHVESPLWLTERLRRCGLRTIDPVVDITNYVLLELGQPMHAFDLAKIQGEICVRLSVAGETLVLLNDQTLELQPGQLVIADDLGPLALAGVMGGKRSAVSAETTDLLLECAFFSPLAIAGVARSYGLHTDSSHRFERGVDAELQITAMERATSLLQGIVGGCVSPVAQNVSSDHLPQRAPIVLEKQRLATGLGLVLPDTEVVEILTRLGLKLLSDQGDAWQFAVPSYRFDLAIPADLIEEVARVYGYEKLPTRIAAFSIGLENISDSHLEKRSLKGHLVSRGFQEVITYSFIDPKLHQQFFPQIPAVALQNPISADMSSMRTSLVPALVATLKTNLNRQQTRVKLFETGLVFAAEPGYPQQARCAGLLYGQRNSLHWLHPKQDVDFYDLKGDVESMLKLQGRPYAFHAQQDLEHLHPGQSALVSQEGRVIGYLGALHPSLRKALDIPKDVFVFDFAMDALQSGSLPAAKPVSKFPEVSRDLAVVVDQQVSAMAVESAIRKAAGEGLKSVTIFDVYTGQGIDLARKSLAFNLLFQRPSRTLTDDEIQASIERVLAVLAEEFNAHLR
jgi:phenylalanyl-tRNA synthetase beta chain